MDFVRDVCAEDALEENLRFVSDALDGKCTPREIIRNYFLKDFYKDHCSTYQKRPIYWMLDFGKKNGVRKTASSALFTCIATSQTCWSAYALIMSMNSKNGTARSSLT